MQQLLRVILAGAVFTSERLDRAGKVTGCHCRYCPVAKEDQEHLFYDCPAFQHTRDRYLPLIKAIVERSQFLFELSRLP